MRSKKILLWKEENHTRKNQFIVLPLGEDLIDITVGDPGQVTLVSSERVSQICTDPEI